MRMNYNKVYVSLALAALALLQYTCSLRICTRREALDRAVIILNAKKNSDKLLVNDITAWKNAARKGPTLVIVESPSKARTIEKFIDSNEYIIDFCAGHIRALAKAKDSPDLKKLVVQEDLKISTADFGVNIFKDFEPQYVPLEGKNEVIRRLQKISKSCSRILLASDEDREGEAISWHLVQVLEPKVPYKRAVFHEITKDAIEWSFEHPRDIDMNKVQSQETRAILDRLTGYTLSPILWRFVAPKLSAGRVQSCGLHLISEREKRRWEFVESKYFSIKGIFCDCPPIQQTSLTRSFDASLVMIDQSKVAFQDDFDGNTGELKVVTKSSKGTRYKIQTSLIVLDNEKTSNVLSWLSPIELKKTSNKKVIHMEQTKGVTFFIADVEERKILKNPPSPFITSSLQQESSSKLGLSPSRTMSIAQNLYENGLITYMRTDSPVLSNLGRTAAEAIVSSCFGKDYLYQANEVSDISTKPSKKTVIPKNAQEAHEAIRPADAGGGKFKLPDDTGLDGVHLKLYELIYRRTLASVMAPSQTLTKTYSIVGRNDFDSEKSLYKEVKFRFSESCILFNGYLAVYGSQSKKKTESFPTLVKGQQIWLSNNFSVKEKTDISEDETEGESDETIADDFAPFLSHGLRGIAHVTKPPSRFTEAGFIQELEAVGVGRPSTYAKIFDTLREREYVIVDGKTIIPTLKGLVVDSLLVKHFSDVVYPKFTAEMEEKLDSIARGETNKTEFLSRFYIGSESSPGLLHKVTSKLQSNEMNHIECRSLMIPQISHLGTIQISRTGAYISSRNGSADIRWTLPDNMQRDIREITVEVISNIMEYETSIDGEDLGMHPTLNLPIKLKSGRFGKYLQIGVEGEKKPILKSLPNITGEISLEDVIPYLAFPKDLGDHPQLHKAVILTISSRMVCVTIEGYPIRVPLPTGTSVVDVTLDDAVKLLGDYQVIQNSYRVLGQMNDKDLVLTSGRFGPYLRNGDMICGLRKIPPETVTFDMAAELINSRGKLIGSKLKRIKGKKVETSAKKKSSEMKRSNRKTKSDEKTSKKLSGYSLFSKEKRSGLSVSNPGSKVYEINSLLSAMWKDLPASEQEVYKQMAEFPTVAD